jgi:hypothetical protein
MMNGGALTWKSLILWRNATIILNEDNTRTINIANNPVSHPNTKQIEIRHHLLRDGISLKEIKIEKIPTTLQLGDVLTKI